MEMTVMSMETVVTMMETDGDGSKALPRPGRVPEQRLLSPEIRRWRWRSCMTSSPKTPIDLGFSVERVYIGKEASSEVDQGHLTIRRHGPGGHATLGCAYPLALLWLFFGPRPSSGKNRSFGIYFVQF
jgi:hypothetical protein